VAIPAGESREIRFTLNTAGTYHYWGSTSGQTIAARVRSDTQLGGAIVVDPRDGAVRDRIFVISILDDPRAVVLGSSLDAVFAINGSSWPNTERLRYAVGDTARWRVVNLSWDQHAMHLHGFFFRVESTGDGAVDRPLAPPQTRTVVTEAIPSGRTFTLAWSPERAGNWLFHCHMVGHMSAARDAAHGDHGAADGSAGMAGLVLGITVTGGETPPAPAAVPTRRMSLVLREEPNRYGTHSGYRVDVEGADAPRLDPGPVPGPVLLLRQGEPVEITIVNRLTEATSIHWHGIELDSYFDGVPGFGGSPGRIAPAVLPDQSFVAKFTPPRAGTFIYHTHSHDEAQLSGGLYGALIVLEPGERYDPATDHLVVIGLNGVLVRGEREPFALNGRTTPAPITMRSGVPNRLRLINITPNNVALTLSVLRQFDAIEWTPLAKDGATLPPEQRQPRRARQLVSVGETHDFEIPAGGPGTLWLEIRRGNGEWVLQAPIEIR
jgi:FtsP/CotA-like multicopper oxidase with cupredoxin domain